MILARDSHNSSAHTSSQTNFPLSSSPINSNPTLTLLQPSSMEKRQPHILVASYPAQGHINPTLSLAKRLALKAGGARITFSTAVDAHRRMFPNGADQGTVDVDGGLFSYIPYSNGYDAGFDYKKDDIRHYFSNAKQQGYESLAAIVDDLAARGHPVTCIIYSFFMAWVARVAGDRRIPCFLYWIQPATGFSIYWHYFHDYESVIAASAGDPSSAVDLPGLPSMRIRDLPSFITAGSLEDDSYAVFLTEIRDMFETVETEKTTRVLANTSGELEAMAISSVADKVNIIGIGPVLEEAGEGSLLKADEKGYMEWLELQAERSVVYVSFGSISVLKKEQVEELWRGLRASGRPYLWVLRKDSRWDGMELEEEGERGMVVEWCSQARVLGHRAVGCFVTHCGWNSTVESVMCGVPTVAVPQWSDQPTNAWLMERAWGTGVRVAVGEDGLVQAEELRRCLEIVMGEGDVGKEIRRNSEMWKAKLSEATGEGGSSDRNLKAFADEIASI